MLLYTFDADRPKKSSRAPQEPADLRELLAQVRELHAINPHLFAVLARIVLRMMGVN